MVRQISLVNELSNFRWVAFFVLATLSPNQKENANMDQDIARFGAMQRIWSRCWLLIVGLRQCAEGRLHRIKKGMGHRLILLAMIIGLLAIGSQNVLAQH